MSTEVVCDGRGKPRPDLRVEDLEECGCCDDYHRPEFGGDCRQDDARFHLEDREP